MLQKNTSTAFYHNLQSLGIVSAIYEEINGGYIYLLPENIV